MADNSGVLLVALTQAKKRKSPVVGFFLSLFLGWIAVDRFYNGDITLGVLKIVVGIVALFGWLFVVGSFFAMSVVGVGGVLGSHILVGVASFASSLWYIIDLIYIPVIISVNNKYREILEYMIAKTSS